MADARPFRYLATFQDPRRAKEDFAAVSALHRAGLLGPSGAALITRELPAERAAPPEEMSGMVLFLCSPPASFATEQGFVVDGGQTAHGIPFGRQRT
ncbi:SDR family oxidoreductase [Deinococcus aestuarii]|uniref:SDR family oxidoreductase n=1 Tax=Deinococcus aestuarii TaxID=2774531 RepID=UPI001C0D149F|nr:SDR family oxidoreductase [Deinococcus aestuarii]